MTYKIIMSVLALLVLSGCVNLGSLDQFEDTTEENLTLGLNQIAFVESDDISYALRIVNSTSQSPVVGDYIFLEVNDVTNSFVELMPLAGIGTNDLNMLELKLSVQDVVYTEVPDYAVDLSILVYDAKVTDVIAYVES